MNNTCFRCGTVENLTKIKTYKNGHTQYQCRPCNSRVTKEYYAKAKNSVFNHYGRTCSCCGEDTQEFLTIDHVNNDGNEHRWSNGNRITGVHLYQKIVKAGFPTGYQTLCMNCNFGKNANGGQCPHKTVMVL